MPALTLSEKAEREYGEFFQYVESRNGPGRPMEQIHGTAAKAGEQALRVAAVLTLMEKPTAKKIMLPAMRNACRLMKHYLLQARGLYLAGVPDPTILAAKELQDWLWKREKRRITLQEVYQLGPSKSRNAATARAQMQILIEHGTVRMRPDLSANFYEVRLDDE